MTFLTQATMIGLFLVTGVAVAPAIASEHEVAEVPSASDMGDKTVTMLLEAAQDGDKPDIDAVMDLIESLDTLTCHGEIRDYSDLRSADSSLRRPGAPLWRYSSGRRRASTSENAGRMTGPRR